MQESIVDFPRHQAYEVGALSAASAPEVIPSPKVRFAQLSAMVVIPTDGVQNSEVVVSTGDAPDQAEAFQ